MSRVMRSSGSLFGVWSCLRRKQATQGYPQVVFAFLCLKGGPGEIAT